MSASVHDTRLHQLAFRDSPVASFFTDLGGDVTAWNGAAEALFGCVDREVLGGPVPVEWVRGAALPELVRAAAAGRRLPPSEATVRLRGGETRELELVVHAVLGDGGAPVAVAVHARDLGGARPAAEPLAEDLHHLQAILDAVPIPVFYKDAEGIYRGCNAAFEAYLGRERSEIVGRGVEGVAPPELARTYRAADTALLAAGGTQVYESRVRYADGSLRDVLFNKVVYRDGRGRVAGLVGSMLDLTERKRAEEALLLGEHRMQVKDRLAALGTLAAGVGHEINNPLSSLICNLNFLTSSLGRGADAELREALGDAVEAAMRVSRVVRDLQGFSRFEDTLAVIDLAEILCSTVALARSEIERDARLLVDVGPLPPVRGNGPRLGQVFLDLLIHAAQSMPARRRDENEVRVTARAEGGRVRVEVRDNGAGIPPAMQARIFDPFSALDAAGAGAGLGLAICHRIVTGVGGELEFESREGAGSVFRVSLPVADPTVSPLRRPAVAG